MLGLLEDGKAGGEVVVFVDALVVVEHRHWRKRLDMKVVRDCWVCDCHPYHTRSKQKRTDKDQQAENKVVNLERTPNRTTA
jgi:hypothetical protein